ncbi:hypothetical protein CVS40_8796 [Lucilia cuprina]|nr:hypothetical protein CVS40_8796 [Lucilia cuprina]
MFAKNILDVFVMSQDQCEATNGNLPKFTRNAYQLHFKHVGIDLRGPIQMKFSKGRGQKSYKGYIAVFVCMTTKNPSRIRLAI